MKHRAGAVVAQADRGAVVDEEELRRARDLLACFVETYGRVLIDEPAFLALIAAGRLGTPA